MVDWNPYSPTLLTRPHRGVVGKVGVVGILFHMVPGRAGARSMIDRNLRTSPLLPARVACSHDIAGVDEGARSMVDRNSYSSTP